MSKKLRTKAIDKKRRYPYAGMTLHFRLASLGGMTASENGSNGARQDSHSNGSLRPPGAGRLGEGDRGPRRADGRPGLRADPAADADRAVHGAAQPARGQEVARAVRDADAQADHRHLRADRPDGRGAQPPGRAGRRVHQDQGVGADDAGGIARQKNRHDAGLRRHRASCSPVTVVQAGPVQRAPGQDRRDRRLQRRADRLRATSRPTARRSPQIGHAAKAGAKPKRFVREVRLAEARPRRAAGRSADGRESSRASACVDVIGTSKGKGFAGVMKRHHFGGQCPPATAPSASTAAPARSAPTPPTAAAAATSRGASAWPATWAMSSAPAAITSSSRSTRKTTCC